MGPVHRRSPGAQRDEYEGDRLIEVEIHIGDDEPAAMDEPERDPCLDCNGTGQYVGLFERKPCPSCKGTGREHD